MRGKGRRREKTGESTERRKMMLKRSMGIIANVSRGGLL